MFDIKAAVWGAFMDRYIVPVQAFAAKLLPMSRWFL